MWGSNGGAVAVDFLVMPVPLHPLAVRNLHLGVAGCAHSLVHRLLNLLELVLANLLLHKEFKVRMNSHYTFY